MKTISNRVNRSLRAAILSSDLFFFRLFLFENVLRRLCAGLVLRIRVLEHIPFGQMAAQVKTKLNESLVKSTNPTAPPS